MDLPKKGNIFEARTVDAIKLSELIMCPGPPTYN